MPLAAIASFEPAAFLDSAISLGTAFALGTLIGIERQYHQRSAGLRTNVLVAVGAAAFVDIGLRLTGDDGAMRVLAYVVSGVGFLGAGAIMKDGLNIRGLNTAATLWGAAAIGGAAGADLVAEAVLIATFVLAANTMLRPVAHGISRLPPVEPDDAASHAIELRVAPEALPAFRAGLDRVLDARNHEVLESRTETGADGVVTLRITLAAAKPAELDALVAAVAAIPGALHASWVMQGREAPDLRE